MKEENPHDDMSNPLEGVREEGEDWEPNREDDPFYIAHQARGSNSHNPYNTRPADVRPQKFNVA